MDINERGQRVQDLREAIRPIRDQQAAERQAAEKTARKLREAEQEIADRFIDIADRAARFAENEIKPLVSDLREALGGYTVTHDHVENERSRRHGSKAWKTSVNPVEVTCRIAYSMEKYTLSCCAEGGRAGATFMKSREFPIGEFQEGPALEWLNEAARSLAEYVAKNTEATENTDPL